MVNIATANARTSANIGPVDLSELAEMTRKAEKKYPDLRNMEEKEVEKTLKYFNKLDKKGVYDNRETVMEFFEKLIGYDLATEIAKRPANSNKRTTIDTPPGVNNCEIAFLIANSRMAEGAEYARYQAPIYEAQKFPNTAGNDDTHANAFKHAIWNALIAKHGGNRYGTVSKAIEKTRALTTLHETCEGSPGTELQHALDLHNNDVGLGYFSIFGYTYQVGCFLGICNYNVTGPADQTMADALFNTYLVVQVNSISDIQNTPSYTLVKSL